MVGASVGGSVHEGDLVGFLVGALLHWYAGLCRSYRGIRSPTTSTHPMAPKSECGRLWQCTISLWPKSAARNRKVHPPRESIPAMVS